MNNAPQKLSTAKIISLIAPAGSGKTEVIVDSVVLSEGKELVLTHTHAGVQSLKARFKKKNVDPEKFRIETIDGFCLRFVTSYPALSHLDSLKVSLDNTDWDHIRESMEILLKKEVLKKILIASYSGVYVDEYQDCDIKQHQIIKLISEVLPCRVIGDPLQGIFAFGKNIIVDWEKDVTPIFPPLEVESLPRRWEKHNQELGKWLTEVREKLLAKQPIELLKLPNGITWHKLEMNPMNLISQCRYKMPDNGSILIIRSQPAQCHSLSKRLGGCYKSIETLDSEDINSWITKLESAPTYLDHYMIILQLAGACVTNFAPLSTILKTLESGRIPRSSITAPEIVQIIKNNNELSYNIDLELMLLCEKTLIKSKFHRIELWSEVKKSINHFLMGKSKSLKESALSVRNQTRIVGRPHCRKIISRTLLVKGLEFDHVLVTDCNKMDTRNLYVALTRAKTSLDIWSESPILEPFKNDK